MSQRSNKITSDRYSTIENILYSDMRATCGDINLLGTCYSQSSGFLLTELQ